jgi:CCR4-NOT transcriptional regulation complex NOT5 subunit
MKEKFEFEMKKEIMDLSKLFDRINTHYENKQLDDATMTLKKNIKRALNGLNPVCLFHTLG